MEKQSLFLITSGETAVVFELEKQVFHQMPFIVDIPVNHTLFTIRNSAGDYRHAAPLFYPTNKVCAVIAFVCKNDLSSQIKWCQEFFRHANIVSISIREDKA